MTALLELLSGIGPAIAAGVALLLAALGYGAAKKRNGRRIERRKQKEADYENASSIRDRVDGVERVPDDDLEFRD